jgi:hypothetical protein
MDCKELEQQTNRMCFFIKRQEEEEVPRHGLAQGLGFRVCSIS